MKTFILFTDQQELANELYIKNSKLLLSAGIKPEYFYSFYVRFCEDRNLFFDLTVRQKDAFFCDLSIEKHEKEEEKKQLQKKEVEERESEERAIIYYSIRTEDRYKYLDYLAMNTQKKAIGEAEIPYSEYLKIYTQSIND